MPCIALISDIHSNIDALEAVLDDIKEQEVDEIVCPGVSWATGRLQRNACALSGSAIPRNKH